MSYLKYDGTAATETAAPVTNFYGTAVQALQLASGPITLNCLRAAR